MSAAAFVSAGFSGVTVAKGNDNIVEQIQQNGYYFVVPAGTAEPIIRHWYRSPKRPLSMTTNEGGVVTSRPHRGGIQLKFDLTPEDDYGSTSINSGLVKLGDISEIELETQGDAVDVGLLLGINFDERTLFEWEEVNGNRERGVGTGGDGRVRASKRFSGASSIDSDEEIFDSPPGGGAGELSDESIDSLAEKFTDDVPVRVTVFREGGNLENRPHFFESHLYELNIRT